MPQTETSIHNNDQIKKIAAAAPGNKAVNQVLAVNACNEQEAVARQKKTNHQSCFRKDYKQHHPEAAIIYIKFRVDEVPESNSQKSFHI